MNTQDFFEVLIQTLDKERTAPSLTSKCATYGAHLGSNELRHKAVRTASTLLIEERILVDDFAVTRTEDGLEISLSVTNSSEAPVQLWDIEYLNGLELRNFPYLDRVFAHGNTMTGPVSVAPLQGKVSSHSCLGLTDAGGTSAYLIGFTVLDRAFYTVQAMTSNDDSAVQLHAYVHREGTFLKPGETLKFSPLVIWRGTSLSSLLDRYARVTGEKLGVKKRYREKRRGWCSWYHYYGMENEQDILRNVEDLSRSLPAPKGMVIQIDDGWNLQSKEQKRVWGDWVPGYKFPQGMRWLTDHIHELGFDAGLWLAPFSVDPSSSLAASHEDWLLKKKGGSGLAELGDCYGLDLTHPEVLAFLEETFQRVFQAWNFDYVKLDFINHGVMAGERWDRSKTSVEAFRTAMRLIRNCAGERRYILNCGGPLAPSIGVCDGMRVGNDVSGRWYQAMNLEEWPHGNCSIRSAAFSTLYRQWMHGHWWENDPDCIITRLSSVHPELSYWQKIFVKESISEASFGLSDEEAALWVRLIWMSGGTALLSEVWNDLDKKRQSLALRALESSPQSVRWVDYYEKADLVVLQSYAGYPAVGLFNLSDELRSVRLSRTKLRLSNGTAREWLSEETFTISGEEVAFPPLPPRSARIWMQDETGPRIQSQMITADLMQP
jgi:alpha-galactosidase